MAVAEEVVAEVASERRFVGPIAPPAEAAVVKGAWVETAAKAVRVAAHPSRSSCWVGV